MGWNLEVAAVRTAELDDAVPDVFGPTATTFDFDHATSGDRGPGLCAAQVGDWAIVIDVDWRLSQRTDYLAEASASTDLHLVRIFDEPIILHYRDGEPILEAEGLAACLEVAPDDFRDGERSAMQYLHENTGLALGGEHLWDAKFTLYLID